MGDHAQSNQELLNQEEQGNMTIKEKLKYLKVQLFILKNKPSEDDIKQCAERCKKLDSKTAEPALNAVQSLHNIIQSSNEWSNRGTRSRPHS
jgi:hypothetical protein